MPTHPTIFLPTLTLTLTLLHLLSTTPHLITAAPTTLPPPPLPNLPIPLLTNLSTIEQSLTPHNTPHTPRLTLDDVAIATTLPDADQFDDFGGGVTLDRCFTRGDCLGPRECIHVIPNVRITRCSTAITSICFCFPLTPPFCNSTEECDNGEVCARGTKDEQIVPLCLSEDTVSLTDQLEQIDPQRGDDDRGVQSQVTTDESSFQDGCVDVAMLGPLHPPHLVYPTHRRRPVLCDRAGTCATPGHLVVWKGRAMMMSTYCALVRCATDVRWVNSPRWTRALRLDSWTDGLQLTAFAAKYETAWEESALSLAVRVGL